MCVMFTVRPIFLGGWYRSFFQKVCSIYHAELFPGFSRHLNFPRWNPGKWIGSLFGHDDLISRPKTLKLLRPIIPLKTAVNMRTKILTNHFQTRWAIQPIFLQSQQYHISSKTAQRGAAFNVSVFSLPKHMADASFATKPSDPAITNTGWPGNIRPGKRDAPDIRRGLVPI